MRGHTKDDVSKLLEDPNELLRHQKLCTEWEDSAAAETVDADGVPRNKQIDSAAANRLLNAPAPKVTTCVDHLSEVGQEEELGNFWKLILHTDEFGEAATARAPISEILRKGKWIKGIICEPKMGTRIGVIRLAAHKPRTAKSGDKVKRQQNKQNPSRQP